MHKEDLPLHWNLITNLDAAQCYCVRKILSGILTATQKLTYDFVVHYHPRSTLSSR